MFWPLVKLGHCEGARPHAETDAFRSKIPAVAAATVDLTVGGVVEVRRVEGAMAGTAVEAPLVPQAILRDHLLGGVDRIAATRTTMSIVSLSAKVGLGFVV